MGTKEYACTLIPPWHSSPLCPQQNFCFEILHEHPGFKLTDKEASGEIRGRRGGTRDYKTMRFASCRVMVLEFCTLHYFTMDYLAGEHCEESITEPHSCSKNPSFLLLSHSHPQQSLIVIAMPLAHGRPTGPQGVFPSLHTHLTAGLPSPSKVPMLNFPWLYIWLDRASMVDRTARPGFWMSLSTASLIGLFHLLTPRLLGPFSLPEITLVKYSLDFAPPYIVHLIIMEKSPGIYPPSSKFSLVPLPLQDKSFQPQIAKEEKPRGYILIIVFIS